MCARRIKQPIERVALETPARGKLEELLAHGISNACFLGEVGGTLIPVALPPFRPHRQPGANPPAFTIKVEPPLPDREIRIPIHTDD